MTDEDGMDTVNTIVRCGLVQAVCVWGSVGSLLTIAVLRRHGLKDSTNILLFSMAICDFLYLLTLCICQSDCIVARFDLVAGRAYGAYTDRYLLHFSRTMMILSSHYVAVVAVERLIAVWYPLKAKRWISVRITLGLILGLLAFEIFGKSMFFFERTVITRFEPTLNLTLKMSVLSQFFWDNREGLVIFNSLFQAIIVANGKFILVVICCGAIVFKLVEFSKNRASLTGAKPKFDVKTSKMLLAVCLLYAITRLYSGAIFAYNFATGDHFLTRIFNFLFTLDGLFQAINSGSNFLIYITMSSKFQRTVKDICVCARDVKDGNNLQVHLTR